MNMPSLRETLCVVDFQEVDPEMSLLYSEPFGGGSVIVSTDLF